MKKEEMDNFISNIRTKLGEENSSIIADDLGTLITDNATMNDTLLSQQAQVDKLQQDKENLISVNGNLLKQVGMGIEEDKEIKQKEKETFSFSKMFDEKGNFIN